MTETEEIEARLREFRPRRPAPLQEHFELKRSRAPFWLAVAAAAAVAALVVWRVDRRPVVPAERFERAESVTLGALTTLALNDFQQFDAALARISRESLPDVGRAGGAFQQLAKP
jgi:hypothetical protein